MELFVVFLAGLLCIILPGIVAVPLMVKHNHTWRVPVILCCWLVCTLGLLPVTRYLVHGYILDVTEYTTTVCEPAKQVDIKWKWE